MKPSIFVSGMIAALVLGILTTPAFAQPRENPGVFPGDANCDQ